MVVLDASVLLQVAFQEEYTEKARRIVKEADSIEAPHILWYEIGNGLVMLHRRRLINEQEAEESLRKLLQIPIKLVEIDSARTLRCAVELRITFCDAALRVGTQLYTADTLLYERAQKRVKATHLNDL